MNGTDHDDAVLLLLREESELQQLLPSSSAEGLSDQQHRILILLPIFFTVISTICSSIILYLVYKSGFQTSYRRILFGLSVADILYSVTLSISPFLIPPDHTDNFWTFGNETTCTVVGTLTQLSISVWIYNTMLSYYYLFIIRFNVRESVFARLYEPWMHALAILFPLVTASVGVAKGMFSRGEFRPRCWINDYPRGCDETKGECHHKMIARFFATYWLYVCVLSIVGCNLTLYCHVRHRTARARLHSMTPERHTKRLHQVATQAFLYVGALFITYIWLFLLRKLEIGQSDTSRLFPLLLLEGIFGPSVGTLNLCIYLRPRYLQTRRDHPQETRFWAVRRALYGESIAVSTVLSSRDLDLGKAHHQQSSYRLDTRQQESPMQRIEPLHVTTNQPIDPDTHLDGPSCDASISVIGPPLHQEYYMDTDEADVSSS